MKIFNKNTKLVFLDKFINIWFDEQIVAIRRKCSEYFQNARLKFLFLFYFLCASYGKKYSLCSQI